MSPCSIENAVSSPLAVAGPDRAEKRRFCEILEYGENPTTAGDDGTSIPTPKRERIDQSPQRCADYDDTLSDLSDLTELSDTSDCSDMSELEVLKELGM